MNRKSALRGLVAYMRKNGWIVRIWASTLLVGRNAFFLNHSSRGEYGTADICLITTEGRSVEEFSSRTLLLKSIVAMIRRKETRARGRRLEVLSIRNLTLTKPNLLFVSGS